MAITPTSASPSMRVVAGVGFKLFASHVARLKDYPIAKPRTLAKSVTVE